MSENYGMDDISEIEVYNASLFDKERLIFQ
jgi:hypothetical protein